MQGTGGHTAAEHGRDWRAFAAFAVPVALLLPFLGKPVHVDDPLYIWTAQHILEHPLDFYGFDVVWMQQPEPMYAANLNPPGLAYYLALVGGFFGWSPPVLHAAMALFAGLAGLGIYRLAQSLTPHPLLATLFAVLTPGFLVSASTIMSDLPLLAVYVWAIVFWRRGLVKVQFTPVVAQASLPVGSAGGRPSPDTEGRDACATIGTGRHHQTCLEVRPTSNGHLYAAAACATAAILTKYFGVTLVPLLIAYAVALRAPWRTWIVPALIPMAALVAYELLTHHLYGASHFAAASAYSSGATAIASLSAGMNRVLMTLLFAGGCFAPLLLLAPNVWSRRVLVASTACAVALGVWWLTRDRVAYFQSRTAAWVDIAFLAHALLFTLAGVHLCALLARDAMRRRDADAMLLLFWGFGALVFCAFFNHMVSARTVLPFAPVAGLITARALPLYGPAARTAVAMTLAVAAFLSLVVVASDHAYAAAYRELAHKTAQFARTDERPLFFARQWGFQYYLQEAGAQPVERMPPTCERGALLAIPDGFTWQLDTAALGAEPVMSLSASNHGVASLMSRRAGAGFYAHFWGPLPYRFGRVDDAAATLYAVPASGLRDDPGETDCVSDASTD